MLKIIFYGLKDIQIQFEKKLYFVVFKFDLCRAVKFRRGKEDDQVYHKH